MSIFLWWIGNVSYGVETHGRTSSSDESTCQNGGTQFNINTCLCPGGLIGKYCKSLTFTLKSDFKVMELWGSEFKW